jgi:hypothetical protein
MLADESDGSHGIASSSVISRAHVSVLRLAHFLPPAGAFAGRRGLAAVMCYLADFPWQCVHALRADF